MVNKVRTINFLPEIFQTESNRQFLSATLDVLTSQPDLRRVEGFIGEKYGYGIGPNDKYVVEPTKARRDYQLDPSVIFLKQDTQTAQDFINYPGIIDALKLEGGIVDDHDRLFNNQFYSWDPFVDYDKIVNYSQYYWIPFGPDPIPITNNIVYETGSYTVTNDDNGYNFSEVSGTNPQITLLRGGTYTFVVGSEFSKFWILLDPGIENIPLGDPPVNPIPSVINNGENNVTIEWTVPDTSVLPNSRVYYQSADDPTSVGTIDLVASNNNSYIDIDDILGKKNYTSPNGVKFTNGLKVQFTGNVVPSSYQNQTFYVDGVGDSIVLLDTTNYIVTETSGSAIYNYWDITPWDMERWDVQLYISLFPEYITITRNSKDLNAWTRANRWFHQDVINTTTQFLGQVTYETSNTVTRAQRPIIEYRGNLKLYNSGVVSPGPINIVSNCTDAFSQIEGQSIGSIPVNLTDGTTLVPGNKIIFISDTNPLVRQNIYNVTLVPAGPGGSDVINLVIDPTYPVENYTQVFVLDGSNVGTSWWFDSSNNTWNNGQRKTDINQYPLFDIFDIDNNSLGNSEIYPATTFSGTKLFSYTPGTGKNDAVLGFPIAYSSPSTIGDILFTVNLNNDTFTYNDPNTNNEPINVNINIGYVHHYLNSSLFNKMTGYVTAAGPLTDANTDAKISGTSFQYQVFEFPEIENLNYSSSNISLILGYGGSNYSVGDKLKISGDLLGGTSPENDLYFTVSSVASPPGELPGQITGIDTSSISGNCVAVNQTFQNILSNSVTGIGSSAIFNIDVVGTGTTTFVCDVPAKQDIVWAETLVYYDDEILDKNEYTVVVSGDTTEITVASLVGVKITVLVVSDKISKTAYYQTAINLENNPFNENIKSVTVGDLRNQYRSIFINAPDVTGTLFGNNNIHDLGNLNNFGTAIIQNSASLVLPGVFLRKQYANLFNSLQFNRDQYQIYKSLLVDLAFKSDYNIYQSPSDIVDNIVYNISTTKNNTNAFFWTDMIFSGNPYATNNYTFNTNASTATFSINSDIWNNGTIFTEANYNGVAVYLTRVIDNRNTYVQLLKDVDYVVSNTAPSLTVSYAIEAGDVITIKEYNQTYGSYCPSTPSKLGLYQIYEPKIVSEETFSGPVYYILGHDGSLNRLYGDYIPNPSNPNKIPDTTLNDIRDIVLFEFEKRVFNNYKVNTDVPILSDDVIPGQFRTTEYSYDEILRIYSIDFLNWVGANRIDYKTQYYRANDKFSYNYNQTSNKLSDEALKQGYWKGIYNYFYDTYNPSTAPWEMLGLLSKPDWWDSRYGAAPYTSGNTYMWQEIADGYIWNDGEPYVNPKKIRPELLSVLPVDSMGNLVSPFVSVMGNYSRLTFNRDWRVGDFGPAESSYTRSSAYPFDLMRLLALTKPAKFFNLFVDIDRYRFNNEFGQYLYDNRYHLNPESVQVYGNGVAKHSYINWIVDYINQVGEDGTNTITTLLQNLDVRLTYRMAGFTSKNYLKFLVEKATPNSKNTSLLIPDESYAVLLYDNEPVEKITYSSVIIQKTTNGYTVWGNSKNTQYFTSLVPKPGYFQSISANNTTVQIPKEFYLDREFVTPYGTEFYSTQAVSEFLQSYGQYLTKQGVVFDNVINGVLYDWIRIIQEFIIWANQGWEVGSIISVNPNAKNFVINRENLIVQPLTLHDNNFLLNQNLIPIQTQDACIDRENTKFGVKILNDGDSIAYTNLNLYNIEHAIVFDNVTQFNDIIYNLTTGLRQPRLLLKGYKTSEWNGYVDANGFILNENNVKEWQPNTKYPKNKIVFYKSKYWVAKKLIEPQVKFSSEDWIESDYGQIKTGLLPNPSTSAYEATFFYDTNRSNLENDADLLSYSLIGFRPRNYLAAADISDTSQINVYKNIVKSKGTQLLAESFKTATFDQGPIDYVIEENWAIKEGSFGSVLNRNYVEVKLDQNVLTGNPTVIGFNNTGNSIEGVQQVIPISSVINYGREPLTSYFLPVDTDSYTIENGIPSAGYVNLGDAKFQTYTFEDLNIDLNNINNVYVNDNIWIANHNSSWNIFTAISLENQILQIDNNLNGTIKVTFGNQHNLVQNDLIAIINFDPRVNGFYKVRAVQSLTSIVVNKVLDNTVVKIQNNGQGLKFVSRRYDQPSDAYNSTLIPMSWSNRKIWSDYYTNNQWAVYGASPVYRSIDSRVSNSPYAVSVGYTTNIGQIVSDGAGNMYRYYGGVTETVTGGIGINSKIVAFGDYVYCSSPDQNSVYVYELNSTSLVLVDLVDLTGVISVTGAIAVSKDALWLYVADSDNQEIALYYYNGSTYVYVDTIIDPSVPAGSNWGYSIATSTDGTKLVVGAPNEDLGILTDSGAVYIYNRRTQRFYGDGALNVFTLADPAPSNVATIYVNDVVTSASIVGSNVTFSSAPDAGSVISVSTGYVEFVKKILSNDPHIGGLFGQSVDTNRYGAEIIIGTPYELTTVNNVKGVEGAVYRYTNGGQRYGTVYGTFTGSITGTVFIDGYIVNYNGTIADVVDAINSQTPTNIVASYSNNVLTISVLSNTVEVLYNILDVTGPSNNIADLGIDLYTNSQVIYNPNLSNVSEFGSNVKMNERDSLLISATTETRLDPTTFDYTENCNQDDTIFDNGTTTFIDSFYNDGVVYMYDYLPAHDENITNTGKYAFGQYITTNLIAENSPLPKFGSVLAYNDNNVLAGTSTWSTVQGGYVLYNTAWEPTYICEVNKPTSWYVDKLPLTIVDINSINNISLYDVTNNTTLEYLDYIDPVNGKILGAIATNINYFENVDPAVYSVNGTSWGIDKVGHTWLNLNTIRLLNYHQPDVTYNAQHYGKAFPGSTAEIYTWVESIRPPLTYTGIGTPVYFDKYTTATTLDRATNSLITKYYFWVQNFNQVPVGKTLSPVTLSLYLLDPLASGIAYMAPITNNIVALMNSNEYIQSQTTALHIGYGIPNTEDESHTSWSLIRSNNFEDFLSGLPTVLNDSPTGLYLKYIESFSGFDKQDNPVPTPTLPEFVKYGTSFRPNQSMFVNRLLALENYINYANNILIKFPIVETRNLGYLRKTESTFNVTNYWKLVDWWAEGYSSDTKPVIEVNTLNDLQTLLNNNLYTGIGGVDVFLENGLIAKVKSNRLGNSEYYVYNSDTQLKWIRIGAQNSTIQLLPTIYQIYGWSTENWGGVWDKNPSQEVYWIIRWLNEVCYTSDLAIERNKSLILMFNFIQSESLEQNNYLPWLNKTSLIDVNHRIRSLLPYKKYQRDNQEFLEGFLNEIKPYHVVIKNFIFSYNGEDLYAGNCTDFDLPAQYNTTFQKFISPKLVYNTPDQVGEYDSNNIIWDQSNYDQWFNNFGVTISKDEFQATPINDQTTLQLYVVPATSLVQTLGVSDTIAYVKDVTGLPTNGSIIIEQEIINYNSLDILANTINGLTRGIDGTTPSIHIADEIIYLDAPEVLVYNNGRGYTEPPRVNAEIDTVEFLGYPRTSASLEPVMAVDEVIGVTVLSPGSGYPETPKLVIANSSINGIIESVSSNVIQITGHSFVTGDCVKFEGTPSAGSQLLNDNYYYVRVLSANTLALYLTYKQAVPNYIGVTQLAASITSSDTVIPVTNINILPNPSGTILIGSEFITYSGVDLVTGSLTGAVRATGSVSHDVNDWVQVENDNVVATDVISISGDTVEVDGRVKLSTSDIGILSVCARAYALTTSRPVREMKITLKFDRISYAAGGWDTTNFDVDLWSSSSPYEGAASRILAYYSPTLSMPGKNLPQLMSGLRYPNDIYLGQNFATPIALDTLLTSYPFTSIPLPPNNNYYDVDGGAFLDGYGPEELVPGYISDSMLMTITTDDPTLTWEHSIEVDKYGDMTVYTDSGSILDPLYLNQWWYGSPIDPSANTTLTLSSYGAAVSLRS